MIFCMPDSTHLSIHGFDWSDLQTQEGLLGFDAFFLQHLSKDHPDFYKQIQLYRKAELDLKGPSLSSWLMHLACIMENFLIEGFDLRQAFV